MRFNASYKAMQVCWTLLLSIMAALQQRHALGKQLGKQSNSRHTSPTTRRMAMLPALARSCFPEASNNTGLLRLVRLLLAA